MRIEVKRIPELDAVRGLAAIGVVLFHAFPKVFFLGWACVDLFFVLSGYLITTIILDRREEEGFLRRFYLRRVCRIWPVYFVTLAAVMILNSMSETGYPTDGLPARLVFLQNVEQCFGWEKQPFVRSFGPSWSVAIEEQYYLVWPLVVLALGRGSVPFLAGSLLLVCFWSRWAMPGIIDVLPTRADGLAWGCFLAWFLWSSKASPPSRTTPVLLSIAAVFGVAFATAYVALFAGDPTPQWQFICFSGFALLFFSLIGASVVYTGSPWLAILRNPILRWFGSISYALYMFHVPIFHYAPAFVAKAGIDSPTLVFIATWSAVVILPTVSWYCLEKPILSIRLDRREPVSGSGTAFDADVSKGEFGVENR